MICHCSFVRLLGYFRDIDIAKAPSLGLKYPGAVAIFVLQRNFKTRSNAAAVREGDGSSSVAR